MVNSIATPFTGVKDITGVDRVADAYDASTHDMVGLGKQFMSGLVDYGTVTFDVLYNETDLTTLTSALGYVLSHLGGGIQDTFYVTEPLGHKVQFTGFVKSFKPKLPVAGLKSASLEIQVSGVLSETAATMGSVVGGLVAAAFSTTEIDLMWAAVAGATGYNVYQGTTPGGESTTPITGSPFAKTACHATGLTLGTTYYFIVKAMNGATVIAVSPEITAATPAS